MSWPEAKVAYWFAGEDQEANTLTENMSSHIYGYDGISVVNSLILYTFLNKVLRLLENIYVSKGKRNLLKNRVCIAGVQKGRIRSPYNSSYFLLII